MTHRTGPQGGTDDPRGAATGGRRLLERRSTRQLLTAGAVAALVVLAGLVAAGGWVFARSSSINDGLLDRTTPSLIASVRLEGALVDQETGVRGYGLTGRPDFLTPYRTGLAEQERAVDRLDPLVGDDGPARRDLDEVLRLAGDWQRRFAEPVAAAPPGEPVTEAARQAEDAKAEFDAVRTALSAQQAHLQAERNASRAELRRVVAERNTVFTLIAVMALVVVVLVFLGLRRGVNVPLEVLAEDVRAVARGDFHRPVSGTGPTDLRRLATDVDAMRRRLADELAFSHRARDQLDEQASELRRSNAELEQFAYVASHDLQEPLRKVASFCQLLERRYSEQLDDRARTYISFAVDGANRMQGLINDLLAFSRVGRLHTEHAPVDLEALLSRTEDALSVAVEEAGAVVTHGPLPTVPGDATQLGMVLQNLLSNALKFRAPDRPPVVHVHAERDGDLWRLAVTDNGIGIDRAYADKVFVIFQRLHTRETYPGNGIGLALCKKIVEYHGGTITIDPDHGPGTRIDFTLPAAAAEPVADEPGPEASDGRTAGRA